MIEFGAFRKHGPARTWDVPFCGFTRSKFTAKPGWNHFLLAGDSTD